MRCEALGIDGTSGKFLISFDIPLVIYSFIFSGGGGYFFTVS